MRSLNKRMLPDRSRSRSNRSLLRSHKPTLRNLVLIGSSPPFNIPGNLMVSGGTCRKRCAGFLRQLSIYVYQYSRRDFPVGQNPVTAGNRSGTFAISQNAIDALIAGTTGQQQVAPGFFGLSGTIGNATFQAVIRGLNQKKGIDLLSAPSVTTKSGQRAVIEIYASSAIPLNFSRRRFRKRWAALPASLPPARRSLLWETVAALLSRQLRRPHLRLATPGSRWR